MKTTRCFITMIAVLMAGIVTAQIPFVGHKNKGNGVYLFGVSASFTDSLVFFTEVQHLEKAKLNSHEMLENRAAYSLQLKDYFEAQRQMPNRTCFVFYGTDKNKLQKKWIKLKDKYLKNSHARVQVLDDKFQFKLNEVTQ